MTKHRLVLEAAATECVVLLQGLIGSVVGPEEPREYLTCPVCGRCITGKNCRQNLRHHLLIHTGEKPYTCPHCPHRANYKPNLLKHIRSVHGSSQGQALSSGSFAGLSNAPAAPTFLPTSSGCEENVVVCSECGKVFSGRSRKTNLKQHILTHTGERPYLCPHCPHRTNHKPNLVKHIRAVHRAPAFSSMPAKGCGDNVLQCNVCGKLFMGRSRKNNLKQHLLTHTGERPHLCPHCPYRSSHRPTLRRHILTVHANLVHQHAQAQFNPTSYSFTR
nr:zinc finger protein 585B-like [Penaeus vannamei]